MASIISMLVSLSAICFCVSSCKEVLHSYIPVVQLNIGQRDGLISTYFHLGFNHFEIFRLSFFTLTHGIRLSLRQLKRILRNQGLFRRRNFSKPHEIISAVERELCGKGVPLAID